MPNKNKSDKGKGKQNYEISEGVTKKDTRTVEKLKKLIEEEKE